jgi:hypothetical protein
MSASSASRPTSIEFKLFTLIIKVRPLAVIMNSEFKRMNCLRKAPDSNFGWDSDSPEDLRPSISSFPMM